MLPHHLNFSCGLLLASVDEMWVEITGCQFWDEAFRSHHVSTSLVYLSHSHKQHVHQLDCWSKEEWEIYRANLDPVCGLEPGSQLCSIEISRVAPDLQMQENERFIRCTNRILQLFVMIIDDWYRPALVESGVQEKMWWPDQYNASTFIFWTLRAGIA